jgi:hypothetical protein
MTSDDIYESDKRQSISDEMVRQFAKPVPPRFNPKTGITDPGREAVLLVAGLKCGENPEHGRMLMSAKTRLLECGICGYQAMPQKP